MDDTSVGVLIEQLSLSLSCANNNQIPEEFLWFLLLAFTFGAALASRLHVANLS